MIHKTLVSFLGTIFLICGVIGIFLPLLPTTPFLLLAAACYVKASPRLYRRLMANKYLGSYIENYRAGRGIPAKAKLLSISVLWATISISAFRIDSPHIRIFLLIVAISVTVHIITRKTLSKSKKGYHDIKRALPPGPRVSAAAEKVLPK